MSFQIAQSISAPCPAPGLRQRQLMALGWRSSSGPVCAALEPEKQLPGSPASALGGTGSGQRSVFGAQWQTGLKIGSGKPVCAPLHHLRDAGDKGRCHRQTARNRPSSDPCNSRHMAALDKLCIKLVIREQVNKSFYSEYSIFRHPVSRAGRSVIISYYW